VSAEEARERIYEAWMGAAPGWERQQAWMRSATAPVSQWMAEAIEPQPGHRVLELAAGMGETGFLAAELIAPGGQLICSDLTETMLEAARRRAQQLGLRNVEFRVLNAESLDLELASVDGVLCRWAFMLMVDPAAALQEVRRVLVSGGRLALAVWADPEANPWVSVVRQAMCDHGLSETPPPGAPGMFAWSDPTHVQAVLADAGFTDIDVRPLDFEFAFPDLDAWWEGVTDLAPGLRAELGRAPAEVMVRMRQEVGERLAAHLDGSGRVVLGARTLVAAAGA
jgi:ubiquinone/menaquinone biosynthesis C-methylase UbiE